MVDYGPVAGPYGFTESPVMVDVGQADLEETERDADADYGNPGTLQLSYRAETAAKTPGDHA